MVITFPHAGSGWVPLKSVFDKYGVSCVVPPRSSKRTLSLGVQHSPETLCLPYKLLLGNMIEGLEMGADTVLDVGGPGMCRLGYYSKLHEVALRQMGFQFQMYTFDWSREGIVGLAKFIRRLLPEGLDWVEVVGDVKFGLQQLMLMDELERRVHKVRPRETVPGAASRLWQSAGDRVCAAHTPEALRQVREELFGELEAIPVDAERDVLRVAIVGEFFLALDPFSNMDIEEELGRRGVEIARSAYLTEWCKAWLFLEPVGLSHGRRVKRAARPYLSREVSGDAINALGETILHHREGFDGIVHILPFTCLPEIVALNIFPRLSRDHEMPVLSVTLDEQMGRAGLLTRLEAFVDLMERRRRSQRSRPAAAAL